MFSCNMYSMYNSMYRRYFLCLVQRVTMGDPVDQSTSDICACCKVMLLHSTIASTSFLVSAPLNVCTIMLACAHVYVCV